MTIDAVKLLLVQRVPNVCGMRKSSRASSYFNCRNCKRSFQSMNYFRIKAETVGRRCSLKKVLLQIWQSSQEITCARVFFDKAAGQGLQLY